MYNGYMAEKITKKHYHAKIANNEAVFGVYGSQFANYNYLRNKGITRDSMEQLADKVYDRRREVVACNYALANFDKTDKSLEIAMGENALLFEELYALCGITTEQTKEEQLDEFFNINIANDGITNKQTGKVMGSHYRLDVQKRLGKIWGKLPKEQREFLKEKFIECDNVQTFEKLNDMYYRNAAAVIDGRVESDVLHATEEPRKEFASHIVALHHKMIDLAKAKNPQNTYIDRVTVNGLRGNSLRMILENLCKARVAGNAQQVHAAALAQAEESGRPFTIEDVARNYLYMNEQIANNEPLLQAQMQLKEWVKANNIEEEIFKEQIALPNGTTQSLFGVHIDAATGAAHAGLCIAKDIAKDKEIVNNGGEKQPELKSVLEKNCSR